MSRKGALGLFAWSAPPRLQPDVQLAANAHDNGFASMLADLVRQNLDAKPHKKQDFAALSGNIAIVADDADVALTLSFVGGGKLTIHDGIVGVPDVTIRGPSEVIMALSNLPLATRFGMPIPNPRDAEAVKAVRSVAAAVLTGALHVYGMALHPLLVMKLTRVMSIHG